MVNRSLIIARLISTLVCVVVVLALFEFYLRKETTYIVKNTLDNKKGLVEQNPEFLVYQGKTGRRLLSNTSVIIKNHYLSKLDVEIKTNSLGFRDQNISDDEFNILALGDSITLADYLPSNETFIEIAETSLNKDRSTHFQVINAGVGNIGTKEEIAILKEALQSFQPQIVVLNYYLNDSRPAWGFSGEIGDRGWLRRHSLLYETIYRNILEKQWAKEKGEIRFSWIKEKDQLDWKNTRSDLIKLAQSAKYDWGAGWQADAALDIEKHLIELKELEKQHNFKTILTLFPVSFQVYSEYLEDAPQCKAKEIASKYNIPTIDLLPLLREHRNENLFFDHCHPNVLGNQLIGEFMAKELLVVINTNG